MDISGFYCKVCKVQMNSQFMWDSHINGKKHIKNVNKDSVGVGGAEVNPESMDNTQTSTEDDSVYEQNKVAKIEESLKDVSDPVVGLDYVIEIQYPDEDIHPSYSCTICKCTIGVMAVVEHIISTKHRMNFVEQKDHDGFLVLENMQSSGVPLDGLANVHAQLLEQKLGRGNVKVKMERSKFGQTSGMRRRPYNNNNNNNRANEDYSFQRSNSNYSTYRNIELNAAETQFMSQIPYFETSTKLGMMEQLSNFDINNDDEAKDVMNMISSVANLLVRYKKTLYQLDNPRVARAPRDMDVGPAPKDSGMGMMSRDPPMGMMSRDPSMGMARDSSMSMARDSSMGMARDSSMGMSRDSSMGMSRDSSMGMMSRDPSMGIMSRDPSMGMMSRDPSMGMMSRDPSMGMMSRDPSMGMMGRQMPLGMSRGPAMGGVRDPTMGGARDPAMGGARDPTMGGARDPAMGRAARQGYNELVGYPQPMASRPSYTRGAGYGNLYGNYGNRGGQM